MTIPSIRSNSGVVRITGTGTVPKPAGTVSGDGMFLCLLNFWSNASHDAVAQGWTLLAGVDPNSASISEYAVYYRTAGGSEPSTYPLTVTGGGGQLADALIITMTGGVDFAPTIPSATVNSGAASSVLVNLPSITTATADNLVMAFYGETDLNDAAGTFTAGAGMTHVLTAASFAVATLPKAVAGATGALTPSHATATPNIGIIFAIRPIPAADTTPPTLTSAAVANGTPTVVNLTMSEAMDAGFVPAASAFAVSGHTVSSVAISGSTVNLTCSAAFVFGEAARTVAYTQPGSNNARDVAGNLLANFSAQSITNNVAFSDTTPPTASSAAVANATPTFVDIVLSEAMDTGFTPASSSVTVSGHVVSGLAWVSSTVLRATVSASFVYGEAARTVAYTQPGANNARDAAGNLLANFTALSITNNVSATDTTAPAFVSAQVANAAPSDIVITMGETLAAFTPATSAFAVSGGRTVTNVARSGATITLTVSAPYAYGDTITVTYTKPGSNMLQDAAGNQSSNFGPSSVTNNVVALGTLTSRPLVNNSTAGTITGPALQSSQAGWSMFVSNLTTGVLLGSAKTALTTNSSGVLPAQTDAAWVAGTTYACRYYNATTGMFGLQHLTAT